LLSIFPPEMRAIRKGETSLSNESAVSMKKFV
jgi:hypothetical protein